MTRAGLLPLVFVLSLLQACGGSQPPQGGATAMSDAALLGRDIFKDPGLSASGRMSCATCHDPALGHASASTDPVAFGGARFPDDRSPSASGLRSVPSIRYLKFNTAFRLRPDGTPVGGFFWDGRANSLAEQAQKPFLGANEMANEDAQAVMAKLALASYAERFRQVFGANVFADPKAAFDRVAFALERYQIEDPAFAPFDSKFDAANAGKVRLSEQELRGLAWFNRPDKGNCAACHPSTRTGSAAAALFTDFSYDSLGVPRNQAIAANRGDSYDLGLCGPLRTDLRLQAQLCGKFKVPSLRNVALRKSFFHNGKFDKLRDVVKFYATRDTAPELWYPAEPFDDLPIGLRANVNRSEAPYNRTRGQAPALNDQEIDDLVAFLNTLTDGYTP